MGKKILIVDDEKEMTDSLFSFLSYALKGASLFSSYTADGAIEILEREKPRMMLLDLNLKGIDGLETVQKKALELIPDIYTIVITGEAGVDEKCIRAGAKKVLIKPLRLQDLCDELKSIMKTLDQGAPSA